MEFNYCERNQFTSALELIGGQTIDGYQEVKLLEHLEILMRMDTCKGCILLLDELPKIDPNTAGILNSVLASVGEYQNGEPTTIQNAKGDASAWKNIYYGYRNSLRTLKMPSMVNFKQDLSLQDRFAGSTYKVFVDEKFEWEGILFQMALFSCI